MELRTYLLGLGNDEARAQFAVSCGASLGHLRNSCSGLRRLSAAVARRIEDNSGGAVMRWSIRPDDWHVIWPELMRRKNAPAICEQPEYEAAARAD